MTQRETRQLDRGSWQRRASQLGTLGLTEGPSDRRVDMLSMPPSGEVSSSCASSPVAAQPRAATWRASNNGRTAGLQPGISSPPPRPVRRRQPVPGSTRESWSVQRGPAPPYRSRKIVAEVCTAQNLGDVLCLRTGAAAGEDLNLSLGKLGIGRRVTEGLEHLSRQRARHTQPAGDAAAGSK